jgi:hypothetical protein
MDIIVFTTVVLAGIALEGFIFGRARKRAEYEDMVTERLARYAGQNVE